VERGLEACRLWAALSRPFTELKISVTRCQAVQIQIDKYPSDEREDKYFLLLFLSYEKRVAKIAHILCYPELIVLLSKDVTKLAGSNSDVCGRELYIFGRTAYAGWGRKPSEEDS
jgi:hypothetical protein